MSLKTPLSKSIFLFLYQFVMISSCFAANPRIVVPNRVFDFGKVKEGTVVSHSFIIENSGDSVLTLRDVRSDCGCAAFSPPKKEIQPGEETRLKAKFHTAGFSGKKTKTIRIYTNDPIRSSVLFELTGEVLGLIDINPPSVYFRRVIVGNRASKSISIIPVEGVKIHSVSSLSKYIKIVQDSSDPRLWDISLSESLPLGIFRDKIIVKTSSQIKPVQNIPVFANVVGPFSFEPNDVSFGLVEGPIQNPVIKRVRLVADDASNQGVEIIEALSSDPRVMINILKNHSGTRTEMDLGLKSGSIGNVRATVVVRVGHNESDAQELAIKVYGIIAEKGN